MTHLHWQRYAALGDAGEWSTRLAGILQGNAQLRGSPFEFADVGPPARVGTVVGVQVPRAIELGADLASIVIGGSDLAQPGADPEALGSELESGVASLTAAGCDVLLVTCAEPAFAVFNSHLWNIARDHGAVVLDLWGGRTLQARTIASRAAHALGVPYFESRSQPSTVDFGHGFKR